MNLTKAEKDLLWVALDDAIRGCQAEAAKFDDLCTIEFLHDETKQAFAAIRDREKEKMKQYKALEEKFMRPHADYDKRETER